MKNGFTIPTTFSVEFVGELERINDLFSKGRVRIYYKYANRNGTWITDDFAEKLNESITYVPIVGTFDPESQDFLDHVPSADKKAYGFVPYEANPAWEKGSDGREYYAVDVILWPGYWPEAELIVGKQHSMELNPDSIVGDWKVIGGEYYFVFQQGTFKGLCALGDVYTPCFEDSAFYSLDDKSREFLHQLSASQAEETGGNDEMNDSAKKRINNDEETIVNHTKDVSENGNPIVDNNSEDNSGNVQSVEMTVVTDASVVI